MIGLIHKILFQMVDDVASKEVSQEIKLKAGIPADQNFRMNEAYCDDDWQKLFKITCDTLSVTQEQAEEVFAKYFYEDSIRRWPTWFKMCETSQAFLERQIDIHNYFAAAMREEADRKKVLDKFSQKREPGKVITYYSSPNKLCGLYMQFAKLIINYYGEEANITEKTCEKTDAAKCEIHIEWKT